MKPVARWPFRSQFASNRPFRLVTVTFGFDRIPTLASILNGIDDC